MSPSRAQHASNAPNVYTLGDSAPPCFFFRFFFVASNDAIVSEDADDDDDEKGVFAVSSSSDSHQMDVPEWKISRAIRVRLRGGNCAIAATGGNTVDDSVVDLWWWWWWWWEKEDLAHASMAEFINLVVGRNLDLLIN